MRITLPTLALAAVMPFIGASQASAFDDARPQIVYSTVGTSSYRGERRYHRRHYRGLKYYRSNERAEHYRTGSKRWWNSMDNDDRGGRRR